MINSLRSGVSGLRTHQTRMDVIGNNIANVNTVGFKRSRVTFREVLGQLKLGVARIAGGKGVNPSYVGRGVSVGAIDQDWSQGSFEGTGLATDLALSGDGFFLVRGNDQTVLSRDGSFLFNGEGNLVNSTNHKVQGFAIGDDGAVDMSTLRDITIDFVTQAPTEPKFTENVMLSGNLSADAAEGETISVSTAVYDEQGRTHNAVIKFTKTANGNEWDVEVTYAGNATPPPFADVTSTATFDVDGSLMSPGAIDLTWDTSYVASGTTLSLDISELTQFSGSTTASVGDQDGYSAGNFLGYTIDAAGIVSLNFSNGEQKPTFQLALGNVHNPNGLLQLGENLYGVSASSGDLVTGRPGSEFSQTSVVAGALEMSNVDLGTEFTDMIVTQRGYQASARVITTSDELLQEIVQLKR
ncbi:MAG: flagellar hook protein FlgE [Rhodothermales bacterium]|nr:flagellar hook protein FlgE [Rhodothermales bacterium]